MQGSTIQTKLGMAHSLRVLLLSVLKRTILYFSRFLPGRKRVAVLLDADAPPIISRVLHRAATVFSGMDGITFEVVSKPTTRTQMRSLYFHYGGLLVTGGCGDATRVFPTRLLPNWGVDCLNDPMAMWGWHSLVSVLAPVTLPRIEQSKKRFMLLVERLLTLGLSKSYVFGTGPSLESGRGKDFSDGYRIVCNTICKDRDFFLKLEPHILVAGDAQCHFSDTKHAQAFCATLNCGWKRQTSHFAIRHFSTLL